jgi:UDP-N-acetylmuramate dehydrogenase
MAAKVAARLLRRFAILSRENGDTLSRRRAVLQCQAHCRAHLAGGATAYGVDYEHRSAGLSQCRIHFVCGACFLQTGARKFFAHRDKHDLWVHEFLLRKLPVRKLLQIRLYGCLGRYATCASRCELTRLQYSRCVTLLENIPLAQYTTLGVGGPARWFVETAAEGEILAAVLFAGKQKVPFFILGGGSNLLVSDDGFPGVVIRIAGGGRAWTDEGNGTASIVASAGADWDSVVSLAVENNSAGIECLAGIPGSVGGTPVQNVGAYGQEVSRTIVSVRAIDLEAGKTVTMTAADCGFSYRRSIFNTTHQGRYAITRVTYSLQKDAPPLLEYRDVKQYFAERAISNPSLAETAAAVRIIRARKGMLLAEDDPDSRSAGSFFKNPVVPGATIPRLAAIAGCRPEKVPQFPAGSAYTSADIKLSAAWLIELAGLHKGHVMGRAGLSTKHVLAIINRGNAIASEIIALRDAVIQAVYARTQIRLEQEPVLLGFTPPG